MEVSDIIDAIDDKLVGPGRDEDKLSKSERAFQLAYGFDDHVREQDFTSLVYESSPQEWQQYADALIEVGAIGYADVLTRFISVDGQAFSNQGSLLPGSPDFEYSEDYDASLSNVRDVGGRASETAYMESVLTSYAQRMGLAD